jgi:hypothetical protein
VEFPPIIFRVRVRGNAIEAGIDCLQAESYQFDTKISKFESKSADFETGLFALGERFSNKTCV